MENGFGQSIVLSGVVVLLVQLAHDLKTEAKNNGIRMKQKLFYRGAAKMLLGTGSSFCSHRLD
jgi:hypothetical protein